MSLNNVEYILRGLIRKEDEDTSKHNTNYNNLINSELKIDQLYKDLFDYLTEYYSIYGSAPLKSTVLRKCRELGRQDLIDLVEKILKELPVPIEGDFVFHIDSLLKIFNYKFIKNLLQESLDELDNHYSENILDDFFVESTLSKINTETSTLLSSSIKSDIITSGDISDSHDKFLLEYEKKESDKGNSYGILSGVDIIDTAFNGIRKGQMFFIAGWTGTFKTGSCINWAVNGVTSGYNVLYITMENTYNEALAQILSCHAANPKFASLNIKPPTHSEIFNGRLTPKQKEFIFDIVYKDIILNKDGDYGRFFLHQPTNVDFKIGNIINTCLKFNNECGRELDMLVLDSPSLVTPDGNLKDNSARNWVIRTIKTISTSFNRGRGLAILCPHQINREGYARALSNNGVYDHKCLADLNEVERSSDGIITLFLNAQLREAGKLQIQFLKSRSDQLLTDTYFVHTDFGVRKWGDDLEDVTEEDLESGEIVEVDWGS